MYSLFDRFKKHKIISLILIIVLVVNIINGIKWVYNDIAYGRFVKIGEIELDRNYASFYKIKEDSKINPFSLKKDEIICQISNFNNKNKFKQIGDILIYEKNDSGSYLLEIYDKFSDKVFYEKSRQDFLYKVGKKLTFIDRSKNIKQERIEPVLKVTKKRYTYSIKTENSFLKYDELAPDEIFKLDEDNLLLISKYRHTIGVRFNLKEKKLYKVDTSTISSRSYKSSNLIQLKNGRFLLIQNNAHTGNLLSMGLYEFSDDKIVFIKNIEPKNCRKFKLSCDFPIVVDENTVIFVGKDYGTYGTLASDCFLFDLKKNKIIKINNFPITMGSNSGYGIIDVLKTSKNEVYIVATDIFWGKPKYLVYKYKK